MAKPSNQTTWPKKTPRHPSPKVRRQKLVPNTRYDDLPEWLTLREAADVLGLSYWTVHQMVHRQFLPFRRFGPKLIYVPKNFFLNTSTANTSTAALRGEVEV